MAFNGRRVGSLALFLHLFLLNLVSIEGNDWTSITCPDGLTVCGNGETCCSFPDGLYGCCPFKKATCCSDHLHCCPAGTVCDVEEKTCKIKGGGSLQWMQSRKPEAGSHSFRNLSAPINNSAIGDELAGVTCPDGQTECSNSETCCPLSDGRYGCCPFMKATCCSDLLHCCPAETICDVKKGMCKIKGGGSLLWMKNQTPKKGLPLVGFLPAAPLPVLGAKLQDKIECPGGNQTCATGYTCCLTPMGDYGCCPFTEGVCCEDHIHCCPKGSSCDTKSRRCVKNPTLLGPADGSDSNIICPGNTYQCPGKSTCCSMPNGRYGCCPLPNATCCSDMLTCCPSGFKCSPGSGCLRSSDLQTTPALGFN